MTHKKDIIESNNLIATYMGEDIGHDKMVIRKSMWTMPKYHESWDWLMPVMQKISDIYFATEVTEITNEENNILDNLKRSRATMDLNRAWAWTVVFIEWNNKNKMSKGGSVKKWSDINWLITGKLI